MNSIHKNDGNDKTLHQDLEQLGRCYAELEQQEPPDLIDQAILNSAHRAVEKKPHWMRFGWLHGLTTTAVFVLAFSLILQQPDSAPVYQQDAISNEPETSQAAKSSRERTLTSPEVDAGAKPGLNFDMARSQPAVMASAPVIKAEKEESPGETPGESESINSEVPSASHYTNLSELVVQKATVEDFDESKRRKEIISANEATYLTETMQKKAADLPVESVPELEAGIEEELVDPEQSIKEHIELITRLKADGDETWITQLAAFKKLYPDFPLPEELSE